MDINLIHIINTANIGGIEKLVLTLCQEQQKNGIKTKILILQKKGQMIQSFQHAGVELIFGNLKGGYDFYISKYIRIWRLFKMQDILHFHNFNLFVSVCAVFSGKKIVYSEHGNFAFGRKIRFSDRINFVLRRNFLNKRADFIIYNSNFTKESAHSIIKVKNINSAVVYNGIDISNYKYSGLKKDAKEFIIGTTSRFAGFKRIDRLIRAFSLFVTDKKDCKLLLVGDGIEREKLEKLVAELKLDSYVEFAGYQNDIGYFQHQMDICVFPSTNEPFGLVAVECLLLGKPVIIYCDGGGLTEIIGNSFPEDIVSSEAYLAERLNQYYLQQIPLQVAERIQYARKFSIQEMDTHLTNIYKSLL
jgi:L-malate glycosyltransferase